MKLEMFKASLEAIMVRFALMMAFVILGMILQWNWMMLLALPTFISALLGIKFSVKRAPKTAPRVASKPSSVAS